MENQEIKETIKRVKHEFMAYRNGIVSDTLRKAGMPYSVIFGLQLPQLTQIAKGIGKSEAIADYLWDDKGVRESRLLASYVYQKKPYQKKKLTFLQPGYRQKRKPTFCVSAFFVVFRLPQHLHYVFPQKWIHFPFIVQKHYVATSIPCNRIDNEIDRQ